METEAIVHKLDRRKLQIEEKAYVQYQDEIYRITQTINTNEVIGVDIHTGEAKRLLVGRLKPIDVEDIQNNGFICRDITDVSDTDWKELERRMDGIRPLLQGASREEIEEHAEKMNVHFTTLYRWLRGYTESGALLGLLPKKEGRRAGQNRIEGRAEAIIQEMIQKYYLTKQRPTVQYIINKVIYQCNKENIDPPSKNTIRNRVSKITEYERLKKQGNAAIAKDKYAAKPGSFEADFPLQIVQIDHTRADIMIVDDENRLPIDRPWLSIMVDVYSRMILGYYLSLDAPSVTSDALCIANAVLPKNELLTKHNIDTEWNAWGFPHTIHSDNGADFRAISLQKSCLIYGMNYMYRSPGMPDLGGHVERLLGTVMKETHHLPGTTFSNIVERQSYDPEGNALMTFEEYEKWLLLFFTKIYHKRKHESLGMSPEAKWKEGIFGSAIQEGTGYPPKPADPQTILIDFLPMFSRTIQRNGINIDGLNYYDHVLRPFINQKDPETGKKKHFICKRDVRDISYIWFYEEESQSYYKVRLANAEIHSMSLWEYREIKKNLAKQGSSLSPHELAEAYEELHKHVEESSRKSKKARRQQQKIRNRERDVAKPANRDFKKQIPDMGLDDDLWNDEDLPVFN